MGGDGGSRTKRSFEMIDVGIRMERQRERERDEFAETAAVTNLLVKDPTY